MFVEYLKREIEEPIAVVFPDTGRVKLASKYARHLDATPAFVHKRRAEDKRNSVSALEIVGEVPAGTASWSTT